MRHPHHAARFTFACMGLVILLSSFPACGRIPDLEISRTLQEAQELFNTASSEEEFLQSAMLSQQILDMGFTSGSVLYNQGNAFMNAGKRGLAIGAYRQAKRYRPRDPFLDANFRFALGTNASLEERRTLVGHLFFWQDLLSYPEKFHLLSLMAGLSLLFALLELFSKSRILWKRLMWSATILTFILLISAGYDWYRIEWIQNGVVTGDEVTARKGNSDSYQAAFTEPLSEGQEFRVLDQRAGWLLVRLRDGLEGWIPSENTALF